jgi:hypothetical protein
MYRGPKVPPLLIANLIPFVNLRGMFVSNSVLSSTYLVDQTNSLTLLFISLPFHYEAVTLPTQPPHPHFLGVQQNKNWQVMTTFILSNSKKMRESNIGEKKKHEPHRI